MVSLSPLQTGLAAIASLSGRLPDRLREISVPGVWIACTAAVSILVWWLTGLAWLAFMAGLAGMVLATRRVVKRQAALGQDLARAERERASMETALREAQNMAALGRLTVGVAHDFNNHLTVISSNIEMVARRLDAAQERLHRHADAAMQGVRRAAALTSRLLSFSHQPPPEHEAVEVDRLLSSLSHLLRGTLGERIGLEVRLSGEPWFTWADVNQTEHALLSLAVHARDQVPDGGVLTIAVSNVALDAVFAAANPSVPPGDYIQVTFGGAVAPADLTCADLFTARTFVREAGGCLLRTEGSSLRIFLPRHVPPTVMAGISRGGTGGRPRILVVEDDAAVRAACVEALREIDYEVLEAPDAMEAFRLIADHGGIDLLFTDLGLPGGVSGRALADAARNLDPGMRVLFTTGYECFDPPDRAGSTLLRKPFDAVRLAATVRDALAAERTVARSQTVQG
jgi:CheY-like chemotaxis protein